MVVSWAVTLSRHDSFSGLTLVCSFCVTFCGPQDLMANVRGWPDLLVTSWVSCCGFCCWWFVCLFFPFTTSLLPCCFLFFFFLLARLIPEQVPLQSGHPVVKIYVGILFLLKLPVCLWLTDRSERNYWWVCLSPGPCLSCFCYLGSCKTGKYYGTVIGIWRKSQA